MRFGSTAKVLLKCKLKYYRISECGPWCLCLCRYIRVWDASAISRAEAAEGSQTITMEPLAELNLGPGVAISSVVIAPGRLLVKDGHGQLLQVVCWFQDMPAMSGSSQQSLS